MIKVAIADDHQVLIDGLANALSAEADIDYVGAVTSGGEVMDLVARTSPDIILLDIDLPEISGLELCGTICEEHPGTRVIGLSSYGMVSIIKKMLRSGASGYLMKNAGSTEIVTAIRKVAGGDRYLSQKVNKTLVDDLAGDSPKSTGFVPRLTKREKQILKLISEGHTTLEIASQLFISENTIESHRKNLLHKFDAKNVAELIRLAMERDMID